MTKPHKAPHEHTKDDNRSAREYRDSVIRLLFRENRRAIELCNALTGRSYPDDAEVINCTPDKPLLKRSGDIAFTVNDELFMLFEHMSSPNPNIPLRCLQYCSEIIFSRFANQKKLLRSAKVEIPTPKVYMLYNGKKRIPEKMKLSDSFMLKGENADLELTVTVIDINHENGHEALEKSPSLAGYAYIVSLIEQRIKGGMSRDEAISASVRQCISEGVLTDFLEANYKEVVELFEYGYTHEDEMEARVLDAIEEGMKEGIEKGMEKGMESMLIAALQNLFPQEIIETLRKKAGISESRLEELRRVASEQPA